MNPSPENNALTFRLPNHVNFVYPPLDEARNAIDLNALPDPDDICDELLGGRLNWIVRTYLQLRRAGHEVRLVDHFVPGEICVAHVDHVSTWDFPYDSYLVVIRADRPPVCVCEHSIVQSPVLLGPKRTHYVPYWPQPGLLPRDPSRGDRIERVGFLGRKQNLGAPFRSNAFRRQLADVGMELVIRDTHQTWRDYRDLDVVLAARLALPHWLATKPSTKLYNSWHAGCPALLGDEPAFNAIRNSDLDFVTIRTPDDVIRELRRLKEHPHQYRAMIEHGHERADEYTVESITQTWLDLLGGEVSHRFQRWRRFPYVKRPAWFARYVLRAVREKRARRKFLRQWRQYFDSDGRRLESSASSAGP